MATAHADPAPRHLGFDRAGPELEAPRARHAWSWRVGRLFGIDLYIHATFLILLAWVAFSHLAAGHGVRAALEGLVLITTVFAIVVAHELGHALTARRFGVRTRDIMLLPIGGIASLERIPEKPSEELLVALAGPAVNLVLAGVLSAIVFLTGGTLDLQGMHVVGGSFLAKLVWINVSLGLFNLLPAFPMDGGRVLRAALALRLDYARATAVAARVGQAFALLLGIFGLFANPMLLLIAFFVWSGAHHEATLARVKSVLSGLPIRSAMVTQFETLGPEERLGRVVELTLGGLQHDFPVVERGEVLGVVTRGDLLRGLAERGTAAPVREVMHRGLATVDSNVLLEAALRKMQEREVPLVVLDAGKIVGLLTRENVGELFVLEEVLRDGRPSPRPVQ